MAYFHVEKICFDYYGTLVDVGAPFLEIKEWFRSALQARSFSVSLEQFYFYFVKQQSAYLCSSRFLTGMEILSKSYLKACKRFQTEPCLKAFQAYVANLFTAPKAYSEVRKTLQVLRKRYLVGLVTNADNQVLQKSLSQQDFRLDFVISSEDAQCNKPGKEIFKMASADLPAERILMVGDSLREDVEGAAAVGMQAVWLNREKRTNSASVLTVNTVRELLNYL